MEALTETAKGNTFVKHVFNFDSETKSDLLNIVQYSTLSLIPIIILNKLMQAYVPEASDEKSSIELSIEVLAQVILMFLGIFFIHRLVTYIPTYSGSAHTEFKVTTIILGVLLIVLSLQTKLGEKVSILYDRVAELWEGKKTDKKKSNSVKSSQPISNTSPAAITQSLYSGGGGGTPINQLPMGTQSQPNYNEMYRASDTNPLVGASSPGDMDMSGGVVAANELLGGSNMFGSLF
jgi:hypothetical protein